MLRELIEHATTRCPRHLKEIGVLAEQIAIDARLRRIGPAWAGHQAQCRAEILAAAERCPRHEVVVVLGGGLVHDIPLDALRQRFRRVILADLFHRPAHRRAVAPAQCLDWDATGCLATWHARRTAAGRLTLAEMLPDLTALAPPPLDADLTVSANLASQLGRLPAVWLGLDDEDTVRLRDAAAAAHLAWLDRQDGARLLISELAHQAGGERVALGFASALPAPQRSWDWLLAPRSENGLDDDLHAEVGAWSWPTWPQPSP